MKWRARRPSAEVRLEAELRDHVERYVADRMADGMSESQARRQARVELGGLEQAKEACRDVRPWQWLDEFTRDVRLGIRSMRREWFFAAAVTGILALGIGTSVAMFSVLHAVVLRPLPYARPGELAILTSHLILQNRPDGTSMANLLDWREQSRSFANMTFYRRTIVSTVTFGAGGGPPAASAVDRLQRAQEGLVGPEFFELLGTQPLLGRTFSREEFDRKEPVVVISEGLWHERFAGADSVPGRTLWIDGKDHIVLGVVPRTFQLPTRDTRLWRPLSVLSMWPSTTSVREGDQFEVLGRLRSGVSFEDAAVEMRAIAARLRDAHAVNRNLDIRIAPLFDHVIGSYTRRGMWMGFAAVLCLLIIACANAAGLLSARAARRRRELAVRSALGAGRSRLIRQLFAEAISVWAGATLAGLVLAYAVIKVLPAAGPRTIPRLDEVRLDATSVAIAVLGGLLVVLVCGIVPALLAAKTGVAAAFATRDQTGAPRGRLQDVLVTAQIAGTLALLVGALLFARSFIRAQAEDPGYPAGHLLIVRVDLPREPYKDREALGAFVREASERIGRLPDVIAVGGITDFFIRRNADQWVTIKDRIDAREQGAPRLAVEGVTPGFFRAAGIDILEGRDFEDRDCQPGAPGVFIVSESLARRFWPGESALGKQIVGGETPPKDGRWNTVVGVVKDMRREGRDVTPILGGFVPSFLRGMDLTIRAARPVDGALTAAVRQEIAAINPSLPVARMATAEGRLSERLDTRRFESHVLVAFAAMALLLSAAGLYAVLAYQVALRTREIGIRSALGADRRTIVAMVLAKALRLAGAGAAVGVLGAASASRVVQNLLYETAAMDLASYAAATVFVLLVAVAAGGLPALRAARVSPITALRDG